ncbi:SRPBCC domain-containing protein [Staphylococcus devriesei]|uniref:SRPBCC domain-containing protein n=1 Tax=Staphylococcus devriesei TaxID=586733 RepID=UPI000DFC24E0|nr:SRPBCC domain-containing protein [Staphylococcus devriesei]MCE5098180.1 SRPBCC domain-containing protein [Staphylococcus devriesei]WKU12704.1 SRPBCC domain-containing protein [Staphylococcus devriesei]SUM04456.1 Uncharacterised protein [Staphylococcus devriesei]
MMNAIQWPKKWLPGLTDNFASNELIIKDLEFEPVVKNLIDTAQWEKYYENSSNINIENTESTELFDNANFKFETFGFGINAKVEEFNVDYTNQIARIAWRGWNDATGDDYLEVYHAWLIETLDHNRLRILTQESQLGHPAVDLANDPTHPMINGHQDWLKGLYQFSK